MGSKVRGAGSEENILNITFNIQGQSCNFLHSSIFVDLGSLNPFGAFVR